jgi:hypothetical protein
MTTGVRSGKIYTDVCSHSTELYVGIHPLVLMFYYISTLAVLLQLLPLLLILLILFLLSNLFQLLHLYALMLIGCYVFQNSFFHSVLILSKYF